jgi:hypothetical protein
MRLASGQVDGFLRALNDGYDLPSFTTMLRTKLGKELQQIIIAGGYVAPNLPSTFRAVIETAEREDWVLDLIQAAKQGNSTNVLLGRFAAQVDLPSNEPLPSERGLESLVRATNSVLEPLSWIARLLEIVPRVCRIKITTSDETYFGTGFLVGPEVILTNFHVMEPAIAKKQGGMGRAKREDVEVLFGYARDPQGRLVSPGQAFPLDEKWLIDHSPHSPIDEEAEPKSGLPSAEHLDYALVRLEGRPGDGRVEETTLGPARARRLWIDFPPSPPGLLPGRPLSIVQHPRGDPLKLAIDTQAIIGLNENQTRLKYRTNTDEGSSGSPCFDASWRLVALHHSGDPRLRPRYNEGIPISLVKDRLETNLKKKGLSSLLGGPAPLPAPPRRGTGGAAPGGGKAPKARGGRRPR